MQSVKYESITLYILILWLIEHKTSAHPILINQDAELRQYKDIYLCQKSQILKVDIKGWWYRSRSFIILIYFSN